MSLPLKPPVLPMLAKRVDAIPAGAGLLFEPKWDGYRVVVFRDGDSVDLQSRDGNPLTRYFPELMEPLRRALPPACVLDGEIVIARNGALDFDALQLRIHPAESRIKLLSRETPASIVFFDLLALGDRDLMSAPLSERRAELEQTLAGAAPPLHLCPATEDRAVAEDWFKRFEGAGLDGVMAKPLAGRYEPTRRSMFKIKHERECDCVVAGFRWHKDGKGVGSLLLGLWDDAETLQHVGVCASFTEPKRRELLKLLTPLRENAAAEHPWAREGGMIEGDTIQRTPGAKSRWNASKDLAWEPLRIEMVAEVSYEHMQGPRFRHLAHFRRWRPDKPIAECTYAQLEVVPAQELAAIFTEAG